MSMGKNGGNSLRFMALKWLQPIVIVLMMAIVWCVYYVPHYAPGVNGINQMLLLIVYAVLLASLEKNYHALRVGLLRVSELIYSQSLANMISGCMMYVIVSLYVHQLLAVVPLLCVLAAQCAFSVLWSLSVNALFFRTYQPPKTAIVYRRSADLTRIQSIPYFAEHFDVCKKIENPADDIYLLMKELEGYSSHLPIMLAYHCGLRKGEVFGLSWDMVDLEEGLLYVRRQMQRCGGGWQLVQPKYNSTRRVRLDPVIWDLLRRTREQQLKLRDHYGELYTVTHINEEGRLGEAGEEIELVMIRDDGRFILPEVTHNISHVVRKELGYGLFDFHSLRHTHATELCENGVNLKEIQRRLGHKSFEVTNRIYLHATDAMERESMEIMKKMYGVDN